MWDDLSVSLNCEYTWHRQGGKKIERRHLEYQLIRHVSVKKGHSAISPFHGMNLTERSRENMQRSGSRVMMRDQRMRYFFKVIEISSLLGSWNPENRNFSEGSFSPSWNFVRAGLWSRQYAWGTINCARLCSILISRKKCMNHPEPSPFRSHFIGLVGERVLCDFGSPVLSCRYFHSF